MKTQLLLYRRKKKLIRTKVKVYFINLEIIGKEKYIFFKSKKNIFFKSKKNLKYGEAT